MTLSARRASLARLAWQPVLAAAVLLLAAACDEAEAPVTSPLADGDPPLAPTFADVTAVTTSGDPGAYSFSVTISSPDTGCEQYADWWEVVTEDGELRYRRILLHSHVSEQPFTRSGGPVAVAADEIVIVRAHMNTGGYGGAALRGSVDAGFEAYRPEAGFAAALASRDPLPEGCDF